MAHPLHLATRYPNYTDGAVRTFRAVRLSDDVILIATQDMTRLAHRLTAFHNAASNRLRDFGDRLRPGPWQDPAPHSDDMARAARLVDLATARCPDGSEEAYQAL